MPQHIELNPVSHITVGTVGEPGNRTFYLQGSRGDNLITLTIEKQQAIMLSSSLEGLLKDIDEEATGRPEPRTDTWMSDHRLREPIEPMFRVGNLGLGYSDDVDRVVIVAYELVLGQDEDDLDEENQDVVSFWASREQTQALIPHIESIVKSGRPVCGNCGSPIDKSGHFCPRRNGHLH